MLSHLKTYESPSLVSEMFFEWIPPSWKAQELGPEYPSALDVLKTLSNIRRML